MLLQYPQNPLDMWLAPVVFVPDDPERAERGVVRIGLWELSVLAATLQVIERHDFICPPCQHAVPIPHSWFLNCRYVFSLYLSRCSLFSEAEGIVQRSLRLLVS